MLKQSFKGVVINVLVDVEGCENIKRMAKVNVPRNGCVAFKDWKEVHGMDDTVNIDYRHDPVPIVIGIWLNDPHPIVWISLVKQF